MILVIIVLLTVPLQYTTCYNPERLLGRLEREELIRTYTGVQRTDMWNSCSYHFSNSHVLSIVILDSMSENFDCSLCTLYLKLRGWTRYIDMISPANILPKFRLWSSLKVHQKLCRRTFHIYL
jgi:uncharacterized Fe-S cluster-containing radical SAM superfamily protein